MLSGYLFCSRKLFLQQVLALKEPPKESTVLGSLRHEIYDFINQSEEKIVTTIKEKIQYDDLVTLYKSFYSKALREKIIKNKSNIREVNLDIVDVFKKNMAIDFRRSRNKSKKYFRFYSKI